MTEHGEGFGRAQKQCLALREHTQLYMVVHTVKHLFLNAQT